ncbi:uncharacterized protein LOC123541444 [Mercenaria mercenaria]|uniref:uncharacterized protein LOC123541444 n=1 Tax=Mercenaria mercenaria TaxID=6596 RepID=UPI00234F6BA0|nr:uncharacterized protein LOC123541444 [Mercenaria mercenaria]
MNNLVSETKKRNGTEELSESQTGIHGGNKNGGSKKIRGKMGVAMGSSMAPTYASLFMGKVEEDFMQSVPIKPEYLSVSTDVVPRQVMDVVFGWVFVFTFLSKIILVTSDFDIKFGHLLVLREHDQIQQCAECILEQDKYVGARVSDETGECEGLSHSWGKNQAIESGYGYAKIIYVQETFEPPIEVDHIAWNIPGVLDGGAKIDLHYNWPSTVWGDSLFDVNGYDIILTEGLSGVSDHRFQMSIHEMGHSRLIFEERNGHASIAEMHYYSFSEGDFSVSKEHRISFIANENVLRVLADDEIIMRRTLRIVRLNDFRQVPKIPSVRIQLPSGIEILDRCMREHKCEYEA